MKIDFNETQLELILTKAVMDHIGENGKQAIFEQAVKYLVTPADTLRGKGTPVQIAIQEATYRVCEKLIGEMMAVDTELHAQIAQLYKDAWAKLIDKESKSYGQLTENLTAAFRKAILGERY